MKEKYQIIIEKDENDYFIGEVVGLPACYTQAKTLPELLSRLTEVTE
ncbi:MAG: type II toxin-antitoxin system HicB family antitoxin [Patescibacteria group bacterium]|nr:type II toxin-antitoxin system HicB family antitoxin [Patescibacteria group bacterium]